MTTAARRRWFTVATLLLVGLAGVGVALLAEAVVRRRERHRSRPTDMMTTLYYRHSRLVRGLVRNQDYFGWARTDSLGLRVSTPVPGEAAETLRILADGGSTTFDVGVSSGDSTWPARLGRLLSDSTRYVQVFNAGVPSYLVLDNLIRFEQELHRLRPDLVVLLQGHNDLYEMFHPSEGDADAPHEAATFTPWGRWLERHSLFYGKATAALRTTSGRLAGSPPARTSEELRAMLARRMPQFELDVRSYVAIVQSTGARVVLVEPPLVSGTAAAPEGTEAELWRHAYGDVEPALVLQGYVEQREVLRRVAKVTGATLVETANFGLDSVQFYEPGDPIHFNDAGARVMAAGMAAALGPLLSVAR